jgi:hypothetical protein
VRISYPLGESGLKTIRFEEKSIEVAIQHAATFTEIIPLLVEKDAIVKTNKNTIVLQTPRGTMTIRANAPIGILLQPQSVNIKGGKVCRVAEIQGRSKLTYSIRFTGP